MLTNHENVCVIFDSGVRDEMNSSISAPFTMIDYTLSSLVGFLDFSKFNAFVFKLQERGPKCKRY